MKNINTHSLYTLILIYSYSSFTLANKTTNMASPEPKVYSLVSKGTNTVIDLEGAQSKNGTKIIN